jgi:hypothetical protein
VHGGSNNFSDGQTEGHYVLHTKEKKKKGRFAKERSKKKMREGEE